LVFLYKLVDGATSSSFGTHVASLAGVNPSVVKRAQAVSDDFDAKFLALQSSRMARILPLATQADFAFLHKLATGIYGKTSGNIIRLHFTWAIIKQTFSRASEIQNALV
jgi:hypothetical protein